jgi:hypothetical protein
MKNDLFNHFENRRQFIKLAGLGVGAAVVGLQQMGCSIEKKYVAPNIVGFNDTGNEEAVKEWVPVSDRRIRVGLVGYGYSKFSAAFGFQNHPNVEVVAVSDLFPDRCAKLAQVTGCKKTYPSLEELVKDDSIEAVFVATDAPSHMRHCIEVLNHGKHVATAVPAVFGNVEEAEKLLEVVKRSGLKYMMFETSSFRADNYAMRQIYNAGGFGKLVYSEGEYYHGPTNPVVTKTPVTSLENKTPAVSTSYKGWRTGIPPQFYPTHSNAYHICITGGSFTEVSCMGMPSTRDSNQPGKNPYDNPFATEIALCRTSEGGMARMCVSWDTVGFGRETGRVRGLRGSFEGEYKGYEENLPDIRRPGLPSGMPAGGHGGSHGRLTDEFITAILEDRKPLVDIIMALNLSVPGIIAHQSAMKDGELMKIPQFKF